MLGRPSTDQPWMSGSGALSHVYIQHPPLRCNIPETQGLYYDDANKLLLAPSSDQVLSWQVGPSIQNAPANSDSVGEGPVLSIRYSLDRKIIGIQRSNCEIQFKNRENRENFIHRCKSESESILGFFWTDCPSCDIILVKTSGIDILSYEPELNNLQLVETKRFSVSWYVYTHESRMILLASGMQCTIFSGFQFSSGGMVHLPRFEMPMTEAEANYKPILVAEDIHIVTIYSRIYCVQHDRIGMLLNLYRFYRDAVIHQGTLPVYSSRVSVSVIDNVLLVHQVDAKVVLLYDIFLDSLSPISAPLPLLLRSASINSRQKVQVEDNLTSSYGAMIYRDNWTFLVPYLICDVDNGLLWRIYLDLEAVAASSSDVPSILEFLQRRRSDPGKVKMLCLAITRAIILERRSPSVIARAIDVLVSSYSQSMKSDNILKGGESSERSQNAGNQPVASSRVAFEYSSSRSVDHGKFIEEVENGYARSAIHRASFPSISDSDDDANSDNMRISSHGPPANSVSADLLITAGKENTSKRNLQASSADFPKTPLQSGGECSTSISDNIDPGQQGSQFTSVTISPDEMYHFVFALIEDELVGDPAYLVAIVLEFLRSSTKERLKAHPNLYVMIIELLVHANRDAELALFVMNKILEPSKEVALQLLESGQQNFQTRKLGLDMLRQLSLHHDFVTALLQDGYYLEALRYARKHQVITVRPALFLEAAVAAKNVQHIASVLRFFSDFTPSFKDTSECNRYSRILSEMV